MNRTRLYSLVTLACITGITWLGIQHARLDTHHGEEASDCLIKQATGIPCPSCGSTRSVFALMDGDIASSLHWNPFGLIIILIVVISPLLITYDLLLGKQTFMQLYNSIEMRFKSKWVAIPAIALVAANWIWNICKGL